MEVIILILIICLLFKPSNKANNYKSGIGSNPSPKNPSPGPPGNSIRKQV